MLTYSYPNPKHNFLCIGEQQQQQQKIHITCFKVLITSVVVLDGFRSI